MKASLFITLALLFTPGAMAQYAEMAITGGLQTTDVDTDAAGTEVDGGSGLFVGIMGYMEIGEGSMLRSGAVINERKFEVGLNEITTLNLDVPITFMYKFNDIVGVFGGGRIGLNISDDCSGPATCDGDVETVYYGAEVGGHFHFAPDFGVEAVFNYGLSELADELDWSTSLTAGVFYVF